jgi:hypothetical protein
MSGVRGACASAPRGVWMLDATFWLEARWPTRGEPRFDDGKRVASKWRPEVMSLPRKHPLAQKPAQDSPDKHEAGFGGLSARKRTSDSLKPSGAHLATRARFASNVVRSPMGDGEAAIASFSCSKSCLSKAVSRPLVGRLMRFLGTYTNPHIE